MRNTVGLRPEVRAQKAAFQTACGRKVLIHGLLRLNGQKYVKMHVLVSIHVNTVRYVFGECIQLRKNLDVLCSNVLDPCRS